MSVDPRFLRRSDGPDTSEWASRVEFDTHRDLLLYMAATLVDFNSDELAHRAGLSNQATEKRVSDIRDHWGWFERVFFLRRTDQMWRLTKLRRPMDSTWDGDVHRVSRIGREALQQKLNGAPMPVPGRAYREAVVRRRILPIPDWRLCLETFYRWDYLNAEELAEATGLTALLGAERAYDAVSPRIADLQKPRKRFAGQPGPLIEVALDQYGPITDPLSSGCQGQYWRINQVGIQLVRRINAWG